MTATLLNGGSREAEIIRKELDIYTRHLHESAAIGIDDVLRGELAEVWEECYAPGWDGYGAEPVDPITYGNAERFLLALPYGTRKPSIGAEPDGHITFDWHHSRRRSLSVSISPVNELHYAALLGPRNTCGTELFFGTEVPQRILDLIGDVFQC